MAEIIVQTRKVILGSKNYPLKSSPVGSCFMELHHVSKKQQYSNLSYFPIDFKYSHEALDLLFEPSII